MVFILRELLDEDSSIHISYIVFCFCFFQSFSIFYLPISIHISRWLTWKPWSSICHEILIIYDLFAEKGVKSLSLGHIKVVRKRQFTNQLYLIGNVTFWSRTIFHSGACSLFVMTIRDVFWHFHKFSTKTKMRIKVMFSSEYSCGSLIKM